MTMKIITILVLLFYYASGDKFNFTNYALYRIIPKNIEELTTLHSMIHTNNKDLDFFDEPVNVDGLVSVVTSPGYRKTFDEILKANKIYAEVTIENIQAVIDKERIGKYAHRNVRSMTWDAYYTFEDIYSWLDDVAAGNSDVVSLIYGGMSYEGREIKGVKISHGSGRRSIFIEGGIHAREWISYATVNYIINELVYSEDPETQAAARDFDWYIFPCTNPDGYVWTHTDFRLWRKNRKPVGTEFGIDLNRNWNSNWLLKSSSTDPSSNTYAGIGPFSEIEARTLASYIESVADTMEMYLSFHSSGQLLMVPYGNTTDPLDNYYDTIKIGRQAMGSLAVRHGTPYITGNIAEAIYEATGTSVDWVKEKLRIPLTYCYELRDRGQYGHLLPADQILPNSEEVMDSVLALIREGRALGYFNSSASIKVSISLLLGIVLYLLY
ncbi:zinc carboxypeptidase-like [Choristoneura fumiferana]|uniref:zinc carboxypeptidase-like n=1 Tax=Choristoneura fumiferana TaxID=7141 RepID=UPI003D1579EE